MPGACEHEDLTLTRTRIEPPGPTFHPLAARRHRVSPRDPAPSHSNPQGQQDSRVAGTPSQPITSNDLVRNNRRGRLESGNDVPPGKRPVLPDTLALPHDDSGLRFNESGPRAYSITQWVEDGIGRLRQIFARTGQKRETDTPQGLLIIDDLDEIGRAGSDPKDGPSAAVPKRKRHGIPVEGALVEPSWRKSSWRKPSWKKPSWRKPSSQGLQSINT